ncbi:hypothetical protein D3C85_1219090 [compost metagenome]
MILGDRGDTAPVVDTGSDQLAQFVRTQIRWCLDGHLGTEDQAGHRNGPGLVANVRLWGIGHPGARLGTEVLDDEFLQVPMILVQVTQGQQGIDTLGPGFADADQDAGGDGNGQLAGMAQGIEANLG